MSILDNRKQCMDLNSFLGLGGVKILVFWGDGAGVANVQVNETFRGRVYNWSAFLKKTIYLITIYLSLSVIQSACHSELK